MVAYTIMSEISSNRREQQEDRCQRITDLVQLIQGRAERVDGMLEVTNLTDRGTAVIRYDELGHIEVEAYPLAIGEAVQYPQLRNYLFSTEDNGRHWRVFEELLSHADAVATDYQRVELAGVGSSHVRYLEQIVLANGTLHMTDAEQCPDFKTIDTAHSQFTQTVKLAMFTLAHLCLQGRPVGHKSTLAAAGKELEPAYVDHEPSEHLADALIAHMCDYDMQHSAELELTGNGAHFRLQMNETGVPVHIWVDMPREPGVSYDIRRSYEVQLVGWAYIARSWLARVDQPAKRQLESADFLTMRQANDLMCVLYETEPDQKYVIDD